MKQKTYRFEDFVLDQKNRQLTFCDESVDLTSKNFEILSLLVENSSRIVEKREIFEAVWTNNFVEENNLPVRISYLRGLFRKYGYAKEFIKTVSGRGYIFTLPAEELFEGQLETLKLASAKNLIINSAAEADNFCFKGQYILDTLPTRTKLENDLHQAEKFFNSAIRLNPDCAEAYVGKAHCKIYLYNFGYLSKEEARTRCEILLQQAQSANPNSSGIFFLAGILSFVFELNAPKANDLLLKAVSLDPADARAYYWLGVSHICLNELEKAHSYFLRACEIKPADIRFRTGAMRIYYYSQDYNRAITAAKEILEMENRSYIDLFFLCLSYARLGIYGEAMRYCDELSENIDSYEIRLLKTYIRVLQNPSQETGSLIGEILSDEKQLCKCLIYIVLVYTAQNKLDEAFDLLSEYSEKAHFDILLIKSEPGLKILHDDNRFKNILEKLSLD